MDPSAIRSRLADSGGRLYWRSLGELGDTPEFREYLHREFPEQASEWNDPKGRRNFLKLMSASLALAGVGACTKQPPEFIVPYVRQPENIVPGRPLFFASAIPFSGIAQPVLVESHMGRPTKIEGNPEHPASLGATDSITQGAVLGLYDPDRAQVITFRSQIRSWTEFRAQLSTALAEQKGNGGAGFRILSGPITSPSLAELMATVLEAYPQARWHQYDPVSRDGARAAAAQAAGRPSEAVYHFDKADVVLSLDADFLGCGPGQVRYTRDFADRRRVTADQKTMNRLYAVESTPSLTGMKADHRLPLRASDIEPFARQLAASVGGGAAASGDHAAWIAAVAKDLQAHRGRSLVIAGEYQPAAVHSVAHAMNQALGNVGQTVTYGPAIEAAPQDQASSLADLVTAMDAGQVQLLVILGGNPVFTAPVDLKFAERMAKVPLIVYQGLYVDETAHLSHWNIAEAHPLESWGDGRAYDGTVTLMQPLIAPLYEGHSQYELVSTLAGQTGRAPLEIIKDYWTRAFNGQGGWTFRDAEGNPFPNADEFWKRSVHDGFIRGTSLAEGGPATPFMSAAKAASAPAADTTASGAAASGETVAAGAAQFAVGSQQPASAEPPPSAVGSQPNPATNPAANQSAALPQSGVPAPGGAATTPQAQPPAPSPSNAPAAATGLEIIFRPDPTVWDGRFANNGWLQELPKPLTKVTWDTTAWIHPALADQHGLQDGDVIELRYRGNTARMPIFRVGGHPRQSITVFFGYGRRMAGRVGNATGIAEQFNGFLLRTSDAPWFGTGLEIAKTGDRHLIATTQEHHLREGRAPVRVAGLEEYLREPEIIAHMGEKPPAELSMFPVQKFDTPHKWGMSIDLTSCTGCGACTIACVAENNIPVVGKEQVYAGREMHWIRVDHYYTGDPEREDTVQSVHQPVPCMQCENAPCELVCPVAATTHSTEGLNDMVYNRCVGTRYCSNNCPYKVRRFNFLLYSDWNTKSYYPLRNPDVTVRSRGVMEKCTYCVQRINQARIDAKREERNVRDGEIVTACQAVCPAEAIVFGDLNDSNSRVSKLKSQERDYGVLEDLNTRPRTTYLAALRNPNPELEPAGAGRPGTEH
jgi:molybdopterin-containing oxidoreductase family iron-sulfur binding subunit